MINHWGLMPRMADWGILWRYSIPLKVQHLWGTALSLLISPWIKPHHTWKRCYLLTSARACLTKIGKLLHTLGEGELLKLHWGPWSSCKQDLLRCTVPGMEHAPLKEGRRCMSWSGTSFLKSISSHMMGCLPLSTYMVFTTRLSS